MTNLPADGWAWWGDEGGRQLEVRRTDNGAVIFSVTGLMHEASVTIAKFRTGQLAEWLVTSAAANNGPTPVAQAQRYLLNPHTKIGHDTFNLSEECNTDAIVDGFTKPALPDSYQLCVHCAANAREHGQEALSRPLALAEGDGPIVAGLDAGDDALDLPAQIPPDQLQRPHSTRSK